VQVTTEINVMLQLAIEWQHLRKAPFVVAQRRPLIEIGGRSAVRDRRVNSRTAARYFPAGIGNFALRGSLGGPTPVVVGERKHGAQ